MKRFIRRGSGNVYRDLGIPDAQARQLRARLFVALQRAIAESGLSQEEAARRLGTGQSRISRLVNGHLEDFNAETLEQYLKAFDIAVEPTFRPLERTAGV